MDYTELPLQKKGVNNMQEKTLCTIFLHSIAFLRDLYQSAEKALADELSCDIKGNVRYMLPSVEFPDEAYRLVYPHLFMLINMEENSFITGCDYPVWRIIFTIRGEGKLIYKEREFLLSEGVGSFIDCRYVWEIRSISEEWEFTILDLTGEAVQNIHEHVSGHEVIFNKIQFPDYEARQYFILEHFEDRNSFTGYDLSCHTYFLLTKFLHLIQQKETEKEVHSNTMIMQIVSYLQEHFYEDIEMSVLAETFHFSASYFRRYFKQFMGVSPQKYLIQLRLAHAKFLLRNENQTIEKIAVNCGFHASNHFIQIFKKYEGVTPLQYKLHFRTLEQGIATK